MLRRHYPASWLVRASPSPHTADPVPRGLLVGGHAPPPLGLPVLRWSPCKHAVATTPAGPRSLSPHASPSSVGKLALRGGGLPRYSGGSAPASPFSRPARRSLALRRWRSDKVPGFCSDKLPCPFTVRVERRPWERYAGGFQMLEERRRTCTPVPYLRRRCRPTWSGVFMRMNSLHSSCAPESLKLVRAPTNAGPAQPTTGALRKRGPLRQPTQ